MSEPTAQQWLDLYGAFKDFCQATPWEWVDDTYVPVIEDPAGQYRGYCVVLGGGGMQYGLAVFMGEEGLAAILALMTGSVDSESADSLYELNTVSAMLADREDLENQDRATIRELGLKYRGRGSWPLFRRTVPGYLPWFLEADEAVFLTMALRYVIDLVEKYQAVSVPVTRQASPTWRRPAFFGTANGWTSGNPFPRCSHRLPSRTTRTWGGSNG